MIKEYWMDTGWGCGWIATINGIVSSACPIFKKFIGRNFDDLIINGHYKLKVIK